MKLNQFAILLALSLSALVAKAADQPALNEKLKPLTWMLGRWEGTSRNERNGEVKWTINMKPDLGGDALHLRYELFDNGNHLSGINLYHWRQEAGALAVSWVGAGSHGVDYLVKQVDNKWIWQGYGHDDHGSFSSGATEITKVDENTISLGFCHQVKGGDPMPDFRITLKRVTTSPEEEIIKLENELNEALVASDIKAQNRILADEWTETEEDGAVTTKESLLADLKSGKLKGTYAKLDQPKVRVYGDAAVVTFRNIQKGSYDGKDISGEYRITDTWIKRDGRWQMVAAHVSRITKD